ncbi:MAG: hypothetical protein JXL84_20780 [Deltaproteobacteria bacterium]|nr:hypothetical protein [Deltaproteobacteria bacterium]
MKRMNGPRLHMTVEAALLPGFTPLLQQGVGVSTRTGISLREFICQELGLSPVYLETRIQTLFLNGRAVDDLDAAFVEDGSTVALSAAMPGLLGATLRRGSYYAAMRGEISYREEASVSAREEGIVSVKLFNLLVKEVGPILLDKGVWVPGVDLLDFLGKRPSQFWTGCVKATVDDKDLKPHDLLKMKWGEMPVFLQVRQRD